MMDLVLSLLSHGISVVMIYQLPGSLIQLETHDIKTLVAFNLMAYSIGHERVCNVVSFQLD